MPSVQPRNSGSLRNRITWPRPTASRVTYAVWANRPAASGHSNPPRCSRSRSAKRAATCTGGSATSVSWALTTDWGYLRMRRPSYSDDDLAAWTERIAAQPWNEAFVFFKHEADSAGPELARRFQARVE